MIASAAAAVIAVAGTSIAVAQTPPNYGAPVVEIYVPSGVLTLEQKAAMLKGVTDVLVRVLKITPDPTRRLFATIVETAEGGFGVDGKVFAPRR